VNDLSCGLPFFRNYDQKMATVSGNTVSAPLIASNVIRDHTSDRSIWSEKGFSDPTPNQTQTASGRGRPDVRGSEKT